MEKYSIIIINNKHINNTILVRAGIPVALRQCYVSGYFNDGVHIFLKVISRCQ